VGGACGARLFAVGAAVPIGSQATGVGEGTRQSPSFVFLGASADVGMFKNCFGDANSFFRTASFLQLGGYTEDRQLGYEARTHPCQLSTLPSV